MPLAIKDATTVSISEQAVQLHNVNGRLQVLKEGAFDQSWIPALTAGVHHKYNCGISTTNSKLGGVLHSTGITGDDRADCTLYVSKLLTQLETWWKFRATGGHLSSPPSSTII